MVAPSPSSAPGSHFWRKVFTGNHVWNAKRGYFWQNKFLSQKQVLSEKFWSKKKISSENKFQSQKLVLVTETTFCLSFCPRCTFLLQNNSVTECLYVSQKNSASDKYVCHRINLPSQKQVSFMKRFLFSFPLHTAGWTELATTCNIWEEWFDRNLLYQDIVISSPKRKCVKKTIL